MFTMRNSCNKLFIEIRLEKHGINFRLLSVGIANLNKRSKRKCVYFQVESSVSNVIQQRGMRSLDGFSKLKVFFLLSKLMTGAKSKVLRDIFSMEYLHLERSLLACIDL